jgi:hypothetical protein
MSAEVMATMIAAITTVRLRRVERAWTPQEWCPLSPDIVIPTLFPASIFWL